MSESEHKAAKIVGPRNNNQAADGDDSALARNILVLPITTSTVVQDILGAPGTKTGGQLPRAASCIVNLDANVDTYYYWSDNASAALDETATGSTTPKQQCVRLVAGRERPEYPAGRYLVIKGASAGILRMHIASP